MASLMFYELHYILFQLGCSKVHCHAVVQTVKAICATLHRVETIDIIKATRMLGSITLERVRQL